MPADPVPAEPGPAELVPDGPVRAEPAEVVHTVSTALDDVPRTIGVAKPDPILTADNLVRRYGGVTAVDVDHVEFQRGVITALIGPNGAGKTTCFNLLSCFDQPQEGDWAFNGDSLKGIRPHLVARRGLVRTFQLTKSLTKLTVIENMRLGAGNQMGEHFLAALLPFMWRAQEDEITRRADELLVRFRLDHMREEFAGSLSGGQRKLLEMARALMTDPELIMLDEPMAGVNPALKQSLLGHIKSLRDDGRTVIFVEHDMDMVFDISDWVIVMAEGKIIAEGTPSDVGANAQVIEAYLGTHHGSELSSEFPEVTEVIHESNIESTAESRAEGGPPEVTS